MIKDSRRVLEAAVSVCHVDRTSENLRDRRTLIDNARSYLPLRNL